MDENFTISDVYFKLKEGDFPCEESVLPDLLETIRTLGTKEVEGKEYWLEDECPLELMRYITKIIEDRIYDLVTSDEECEEEIEHTRKCFVRLIVTRVAVKKILKNLT